VNERKSLQQPVVFQSTRSERSATAGCSGPALPRLISIHALRAERDISFPPTYKSGYISIHALRAERDRDVVRTGVKFRNISIHALRAERDQCLQRIGLHNYYFNPRAPSGARQYRGLFDLYSRKISIHALRAERD